VPDGRSLARRVAEHAPGPGLKPAVQRDKAMLDMWVTLGDMPRES